MTPGAQRAAASFLISILLPALNTSRQAFTWPAATSDFNPRIPYGMRQRAAPCVTSLRQFQSISSYIISIHASRTRCDCCMLYAHLVIKISIHASRTGCDVVDEIQNVVNSRFQSTHPARDATANIYQNSVCMTTCMVEDAQT